MEHLMSENQRRQQDLKQQLLAEQLREEYISQLIIYEDSLINSSAPAAIKLKLFYKCLHYLEYLNVIDIHTAFTWYGSFVSKIVKSL